METKKGKFVDLLKINAEVGWNCNFDCEECYRFFDCPSPSKHKMYERGRMDKVREKLDHINHIVAVLSGKGGVGKSTIAANLAVALARKGFLVGIIDSDFYGPSIPKILGIRRKRVKIGSKGIIPAVNDLGIKVMSTNFLLEDQESLTWFHGLKRGAIEVFLAHTDYGELDYLIIDLPPGTGSETINVIKYIPKLSGVVVVTIPSQVSKGVARRGISLCQKAHVPIIGLIENMSGYICSGCETSVDILCYGGGEELARETGIPFLGRIPLEKEVCHTSDKGNSFLIEYPESLASRNFSSIVGKVEDFLGKGRLKKKGKVFEKSIEEENLPEILKINLDYSCYGKNCNSCEKYFECNYEKKGQIQTLGRMEKIRERMRKIGSKIAVLSGKGGVGKSTVSANLAIALAKSGKTTVIIDSDFHGPCIPKILGTKGKKLKIGDNGILPIPGPFGVGVVSMAFMLEEDEAVTWFHNLKRGAIEEFLAETDYGELDYLIIDLPPGTGSESYNVLQCLPDLDGVVVVTIPSQVSRGAVRRGISLCQKAHVPIIGLIENMSGFVCPNCGQISNILTVGGGEELTKETGIPFLGKIPLDQRVSSTSDKGSSFLLEYPESPAARSFFSIVERIKERGRRNTGW